MVTVYTMVTVYSMVTVCYIPVQVGMLGCHSAMLEQVAVMVVMLSVAVK